VNAGDNIENLAEPLQRAVAYYRKAAVVGRLRAYGAG
jgi:hypothetical protein